MPYDANIKVNNAVDMYMDTSLRPQGENPFNNPINVTDPKLTAILIVVRVILLKLFLSGYKADRSAYPGK